MKNPNSKGFSLLQPSALFFISFSFSEYRKKCDQARTRLDALQQKTKQYRELMINLNGNSEKKLVHPSREILRQEKKIIFISELLIFNLLSFV